MYAPATLHLLPFLTLPQIIKARRVPINHPHQSGCAIPRACIITRHRVCPGVQLAAGLLMCKAEWNPAWLFLAVWAQRGSQNTYLFVSGNSTAAAQGLRKQICRERPCHHSPQPTTTTLLAQRREDCISSAESLHFPARVPRRNGSGASSRTSTRP